MSLFESIAEAPIDPILGTTQLYNADTDPRKINLGVGAYRTEEGKPFVLDIVKKAEDEVRKKLDDGSANKEYSTIDGPAELKTFTQQLLFGKDSEAVTSGRVASVQALSGTGALRVAAEFVKTHLPAEAAEVWVSDPTWGNHNTIFAMAGLTVKTYPYWDASTKSLNLEGMLGALKNDAKTGSMILLHACAHNPTGVDPTEEQWKKIVEVMKEKKNDPIDG